jgi:hypothetical protein
LKQFDLHELVIVIRVFIFCSQPKNNMLPILYNKVLVRDFCPAITLAVVKKKLKYSNRAQKVRRKDIIAD